MNFWLRLCFGQSNVSDYVPWPEMTHAYIITRQLDTTNWVSLAARGGGFAPQNARDIHNLSTSQHCPEAGITAEKSTLHYSNRRTFRWKLFLSLTEKAINLNQSKLKLLKMQPIYKRLQIRVLELIRHASDLKWGGSLNFIQLDVNIIKFLHAVIFSSLVIWDKAFRRDSVVSYRRILLPSS